MRSRWRTAFRDAALLAAAGALWWFVGCYLPEARAAAEPRYPLATATDPNPLRIVATTPSLLAKATGCGCREDSTRARTWPRLIVAVQRRAIDYAHPRFNPESLAVSLPCEPSKPCTVYVAHQQPGDVLLARWRNPKASCWFGAKDSTGWRPIAAW